MEELIEEILAADVENPQWELRHFDEQGTFVGPKHIGEMIAQMLEEEI